MSSAINVSRIKKSKVISSTYVRTSIPFSSKKMVCHKQKDLTNGMVETVVSFINAYQVRYLL